MTQKHFNWYFVFAILSKFRPILCHRTVIIEKPSVKQCKRQKMSKIKESENDLSLYEEAHGNSFLMLSIYRKTSSPMTIKYFWHNDRLNTETFPEPVVEESKTDRSDGFRCRIRHRSWVRAPESKRPVVCITAPEVNNQVTFVIDGKRCSLFLLLLHVLSKTIQQDTIDSGTVQLTVTLTHKHKWADNI